MKDHWLDAPRNVRLLWNGFLIILAASVIVGFLVDLHPHFTFESWAGFNAAYGFIACILMIVVAKLLALWLKRPDDYYNQKNDEAKQ